VQSHIVIIGAGQAGLQACESLRSEGYKGQITLFGDEPHAPYHRPPLSKAWLAGTLDDAQLTMRSAAVLARKEIDLRTSTRVDAIEPARHSITLSNGTSVSYSGLVIATGATPRTLSCSASSKNLVRVLRSRDDASAVAWKLKECIETGRPLVIIGGGFIGLEAAATARNLGVSVTILEAAPRLVGRVLAPTLSEWYARLHCGHGAGLEFNTRVLDIHDASPGMVEVQLADGRNFLAGLVLIGVGVVPNDTIACAAGIACDVGIIVDACGRTSVPDIVAAGDCAIRRMENGRMLRLESVQNAVEQGKSAAAALLGIVRPVAAVPWFWSDQYDKKLQIAGLSAGADSWTVRGEMGDSRGFSVYHFQNERLVAVDSINSPKDHLVARNLLAAGASPTREQAADTDFDLASLMKKN
jgi:3-phenylpropionate/trans-cinnamate dioxygenase ferredoxin reductase subunit